MFRKNLFTFLLLLPVGTIIFIVLFFNYYTPDLNKISQNTRQSSVTIRDINSNVLATYGDIYSGHVKINKISNNLINAVVSIEDHRFYDHYGVDLKGISRAIYVNLIEGEVVQGGSTITQQLSKLLFLNSERSFIRKIKELFITIELERFFTKDEILSLYLNRVYFGSGNYGIASASKNYFSKQPKDLTVHEAAILAASLKAPSRLNPISALEENKNRAKLVIKKMYEYKYISLSEYEEEIKNIEDIIISNKVNIHRRYFTDWVFRRSSSYGNNAFDIDIKTTFDPVMQSYVEDSVSKIIKNKDLQAAVMVMDTSGAVKAMLGGKSYYNSQYNRATQAKRQPGSVFKLFTYISAFDAGLKVDDKIDDMPLDLEGWKPQNYNKQYKGKITLSDAFAMSSNVAAVRLQEIVGRKKIINWAKRLGVSAKLRPERSLTLGTQGISLIEMTNAYISIASGGKAAFPYAVTEIIDRKGNVLYKRNIVKRSSIMDKDIYFSMRYLLNYSILKGTAKKGKPRNFYNNDVLLGGKTGTTQDSKDAWFIGYFNSNIIGVWVGRDDNKTTPGLYGGNQPALIFRDIVEKLIE